VRVPSAGCGGVPDDGPALEQLAWERAGRLKVVKFNVDKYPTAAARYEVHGIPLLVLTRDGDELARLTGAAPLPHLQSWLDSRPPRQCRRLPRPAPGPVGARHAWRRRRSRQQTELRSLFEQAAAATHDPGELLEAVNAMLPRPTATAVAVPAGPDGGNLRWATAGHPPPRRLDTGEQLPAPQATHRSAGRTAAARGPRRPEPRAPGCALHRRSRRRHRPRTGCSSARSAPRALQSRRAGSALDELMRIVCDLGADTLSDDAGAVVLGARQP
jgi:hypothetical protein